MKRIIVEVGSTSTKIDLYDGEKLWAIDPYEDEQGWTIRYFLPLETVAEMLEIYMGVDCRKELREEKFGKITINIRHKVRRQK